MATNKPNSLSYEVRRLRNRYYLSVLLTGILGVALGVSLHFNIAYASMINTNTETEILYEEAIVPEGLFEDAELPPSIEVNDEIYEESVEPEVLTDENDILLKDFEFDAVQEQTVEVEEYTAVIEHATFVALMGEEPTFDEPETHVFEIVAPTRFNETEVTSNEYINESDLRATLEVIAPELVGIEGAVLEVYRDYGIKPSFQIAKFCLESGYGKSGLSKDKNNIAGWNAYPTGGRSAYQNATSFASKADCVKVVGEGLSKNYIDRGLTSVSGISKKYCPPNSANWTNMTHSLMNKVDSVYTNIRASK